VDQAGHIGMMLKCLHVSDWKPEGGDHL